MTWILDLYQTYEDNIDQVGIPVVRNGKEFALLPVGHAYRNAQIEVRVTPKGEFYDAKVVDKKHAPTMIPVTDGSGSRTSGVVPHPLHDGLQYVAGDFTEYVDVKIKSGKNKVQTPYEQYIEQLEAWKDEHPKVRAVYEYLKKGTLISDLVQEKILHVDKNEKLIPKWTKEWIETNGEKPEIFSVVTQSQEKAFVRFSVHDPYSEENDLPIWEDESVNEAVTQYFSEGAEGLDYVTGETMRTTEAHASGLRYAGDMAKLISANDSKNYTYRGRFSEKSEVAEVGYEVSQKAHNALKWLIDKQGIVRDGRVYLVWGNELPENLNPLSGSYDLFDDEDEISTPTDRTQSEYAQLVKEAIYGKNNELATRAKVNIMILDNATPGRIGILYYNAIDQVHYLRRIEEWQKRSTWRHTYYVNKIRHYSYGSPRLFEIAKAAFGEKANDKILNNATTTLFTCIIENKSVPFNIVRNLVNKASNPQAFEYRSSWQRTLTAACSMVNHYYFEGGCQVSLNTESNERNYLFGRLLAVSHVLERQALNESGGGSRTTNAERYMNAFSMRPVKTWMIIRGNLQPYINRLGKKAIFYNKLFDEIMNLFNEESFTDKALDGRYLLGYYSQEYAIYNKKTTEEEA